MMTKGVGKKMYIKLTNFILLTTISQKKSTTLLKCRVWHPTFARCKDDHKIGQSRTSMIIQTIYVAYSIRAELCSSKNCVLFTVPKFSLSLKSYIKPRTAIRTASAHDKKCIKYPPSIVRLIRVVQPGKVFRKGQKAITDYYIPSDVSHFHSVSCKFINPQSHKKITPQKTRVTLLERRSW